ncbi:MAG: ATP-binding protein [Candidatus Eisenbacteria sp.]|nr:ATP-binding protein [Candidatus Eisenbacteria bacterium]
MTNITRFFDSPGQSFFLLGPRGTGKSTWLRTRYPDALLLDLLDPETERVYSARPERLRQLIDASSGTKRVIVDEIQRVPSLLPVVHSLIEEKRGLEFILTGSSARKIKRAGVDLLAGRALLRTMHTFMAAELGRAFRLDQALQLGLLPLVVTSHQPAETLRSYVALYVREEVKMEGLVRNIGSFSRFLEAASISHATVLNVSNIARECAVGRNTVEDYLTVIEDLLIAFRFPVFTHRAKRQLAAHPKFFFFDAGVYGSLRPRGPLDKQTEIMGPALEGLVVQHLRAWNAYRGERNGLYYWRTRSGVEVDIVLYGEDGLWAIEVKSARQVHSVDLRALKAFREDYPECKAILLYRGRETLRIDEVLCMPCEAFLVGLTPSGVPPG